MIERCIRCGNWIRPAHLRRSFHPVLGDIAQHVRCADRYKGTDVHYLHKPDRAAPSEAFTAKDENGAYSVYDVMGIWEDLCIKARRPWLTATIPLAVSESIMRSNEVDPADARAIWEARKAEGTHDMPIILIERPDGQNFPIDGSHRIAYAYLTGREEINAWVVQKHETDDCYRIDNWNPALSQIFDVQG